MEYQPGAESRSDLSHPAHPLPSEFPHTMPISLYQASIPVFTRALANLARILDKAATHAAETGTDPATLLGARLAPDMFPLTHQVQSACDAAKLAATRLSGITPPVDPDTETTFPELQARIAKTLALLNSVQPAQIDGQEERVVVLKTPSRELTFNGQSYLLAFALPNFYFHMTTAYAILRNQGVAIGKLDYLGGI